MRSKSNSNLSLPKLKKSSRNTEGGNYLKLYETDVQSQKPPVETHNNDIAREFLRIKSKQRKVESTLKLEPLSQQSQTSLALPFVPDMYSRIPEKVPPTNGPKI